MQTERAERMVPVYRANQPSDQNPSFFVSFREAKSLVVLGEARVINRNKAIRMISERPVTEIRDESCRMGPNVIFANAAGRPWARAITEAWARRPSAEVSQATGD